MSHECVPLSDLHFTDWDEYKEVYDLDLYYGKRMKFCPFCGKELKKE